MESIREASKRATCAKLEKCEIWLDIISFLGHVISREGVAVDPKKVKTVVEWTRPMNMFEI
jgi:hypothetical protein